MVLTTSVSHHPVPVILRFVSQHIWCMELKSRAKATCRDRTEPRGCGGADMQSRIRHRTETPRAIWVGRFVLRVRKVRFEDEIVETERGVSSNFERVRSCTCPPHKIRSKSGRRSPSSDSLFSTALFVYFGIKASRSPSHRSRLKLSSSQVGLILALDFRFAIF